MGFLKRIDRAGELFGGMAQRLGLDPAKMVADDPMGAERYRAAMLACSGCKSPEACMGWQIEHDRAKAPPAYCRNHDMLAAMTRS